MKKNIIDTMLNRAHLLTTTLVIKTSMGRREPTEMVFQIDYSKAVHKQINESFDDDSQVNGNIVVKWATPNGTELTMAGIVVTSAEYDWERSPTRVRLTLSFILLEHKYYKLVSNTESREYDTPLPYKIVPDRNLIGVSSVAVIKIK